jgi:hypothetical protein
MVIICQISAKKAPETLRFVTLSANSSSIFSLVTQVAGIGVAELNQNKKTCKLKKAM